MLSPHHDHECVHYEIKIRELNPLIFAITQEIMDQIREQCDRVLNNVSVNENIALALEFDIHFSA